MLTGLNATLSLLRKPKAHYILYEVVKRGFHICVGFRVKKQIRIKEFCVLCM